jgi:hypothetical protein
LSLLPQISVGRFSDRQNVVEAESSSLKVTAVRCIGRAVEIDIVVDAEDPMFMVSML